MKNTATRVLMLIFGILLIGLGIVLFASPIANSVVLAYVICILMAVYGIAEIIFYIVRRKDGAASGWALTDGIITTILGLMLLFIPGAQIPTMTILFAFWVLFTGVTRTAAAFTSKSAGARNWGFLLVVGIIGILLGIWLLCDPLLAVVTIGYLLPLAFLVQGVSAIATFFSSKG